MWPVEEISWVKSHIQVFARHEASEFLIQGIPYKIQAPPGLINESRASNNPYASPGMPHSQIIFLCLYVFLYLFYICVSIYNSNLSSLCNPCFLYRSSCVTKIQPTYCA